MHIDMTVELQTALVERLKTTLANTVAENLTLAIVAESFQAELIRITKERDQLVEANTRLNTDVSELRAALVAKDRVKNTKTE